MSLRMTCSDLCRRARIAGDACGSSGSEVIQACAENRIPRLSRLSLFFTHHISMSVR